MTDKPVNGHAPPAPLAVGLMSNGDVFVEFEPNGRYAQLSPAQALAFAQAIAEAAQLSPKAPGKQ